MIEKLDMNSSLLSRSILHPHPCQSFMVDRGTSLPFDFGFSHGTCFGQWDIHRFNVRED